MTLLMLKIYEGVSIIRPDSYMKLLFVIVFLTSIISCDDNKNKDIAIENVSSDVWFSTDCEEPESWKKT